MNAGNHIEMVAYHVEMVAYHIEMVAYHIEMKSNHIEMVRLRNMELPQSTELLSIHNIACLVCDAGMQKLACLSA